MMNRENLSSLLSGVLFALGLGFSGMTQPQKVVGFLNVFGNWDPSLVFVMGGAVLVYAIGYRFVIKMPKPLFTTQFMIPSNRQLDSALITGSVLFGVGWGISGFCPGPALTSIVSLNPSSLIFVASMLMTMLVFERWEAKKRPQ